MAQYSVLVRRQAVEEAYVDVEAKDEEDAKSKVMDELASHGLDGWEYVTSLEEWVERVIVAEEEDPDHVERSRRRPDWVAKTSRPAANSYFPPPLRTG